MLSRPMRKEIDWGLRVKPALACVLDNPSPYVELRTQHMERRCHSTREVGNRVQTMCNFFARAQMLLGSSSCVTLPGELRTGCQQSLPIAY